MSIWWSTVWSLPSMTGIDVTDRMIRFLDVVLAGLASVVLLPLFGLVALVLRFTGEREVFYRQCRIGRGGREFRLLKFATMLKESPSIATGDLTVSGDPRVLPTGRFLRASKINELPQLFNVLKGDMSLIGPRPQTPAHFALIPVEFRAEILAVRPGLSGPAAILFRDEDAVLSRVADPVDYYARVIAPVKGRLDAAFAAHRSLSSYFLLICATALVVAGVEPRRMTKWFRWMPEARG